MPTEISLEEAQRLVAEGAQIVEVLPAKEYDEEHLPGAISLPLKELTSERASSLDAGRPIVVYCWNDT